MVGLVREFKDAYLRLVRGESDMPNSDRFRCLERMHRMQDMNLIGHMMEILDNYMSDSQRVMFHLIQNAVQLTDRLYYTFAGDVMLLVDVDGLNKYGQYGVIYSINIKKTDVDIMSNGDIVVYDKYSVANTVFSYGDKYADNIQFLFPPELDGIVTVSNSVKGSDPYLAVAKNYFGKFVNIKVHHIIYGLVKGYEVLLSMNSTRVFVINHIDGVKVNNNPSNLEMVAQSRNVQHAVEMKSAKMKEFIDKHFKN